MAQAAAKIHRPNSVSRAFTSATETVDYDGVAFTVRPLPATMAGIALASQSSGEAGAAFDLAVRHGLVGWSAHDPAFHPDDPDANLERLTIGAYTAIAQAVMSLTFLSEDEAGN